LLNLRKNRKGPLDKRYHVAMLRARQRGWSVAALAVAVESTPVAVAQLIHRAKQHPPQNMRGIVIPKAPPAGPAGPNVQLVTDAAALLPPEQVQRMRDRQKLARQVVCHLPPDDPRRVASRQLAEELYHLLFERNLPAERVAEDILHVTKGAVSNRLRVNGLPGTRREYEEQQKQKQRKRKRAGHGLAA
jgi:hypothetical protein